jgi:hypothetical protein
MAQVDDVISGLGMATASAQQKVLIQQKVDTVKMYMSNAGVSAAALVTSGAVGVIVLGVNDIWDMSPGEVRFSPVFDRLVAQMAINCLEDPAET